MDENDKPSAKLQIRREIIYRVWTLTDVNENSYGNAHEEAGEGTSIEDAAFMHELNVDEETLYTEIFDQAIQSDGPDSFYSIVQLVDEATGNVLKQGFTSDSLPPGSIDTSVFYDANVANTEPTE